MSQEASGLKEDRKKVFKRAFFMASGTLTSRVLGLLRDMALGAFFDRSITDAWTAAFRLPNLFRRLFGEGALSVSFIPVFIQTQAEDPSGKRSHNLVNGFYTLLLIFMSLLTLLAVISMEQVLGFFLADAFKASPEKWILTVRMARIMFGFVFCVTTYAYFMGLLNALGLFGLPALAPALLNISMLVFTFVPGAWFSVPGDGLAWGVLVGGLLQMLLVWWALSGSDYVPKLRGTFWNRDVLAVLKNMLPGLAGMGLLQFSTLINLYFASSLAEGALSSIYWADRLLELPLSLVSVSLGSALLPTLSQFAAQKKWDQFRETSQETFLMTFFLSWPAALGLYFLAEPMVEVLFKRGQFSAADVARTALILKISAAGLVALSLSRVLVPSYYAVKNTLFPAMVALGCLSVHFFISSLWVQEQGLLGLMKAGVVAFVLNLVCLLIGLHYFKVSYHGLSLAKAGGKTILAGAGMVGALFVAKIFLGVGVGEASAARLMAVIVIAALSYFVLAMVLRCEEAARFRRLLRR